NRALSVGEIQAIHTLGVTKGGALIQGNMIGTNVAGTAVLANGGAGINVNGSANNTIGGLTAATRNIISGNSQNGIVISGATAVQNVVQGNYIGADKNGNALIPGTVAWYKAEGNANDSADGNPGALN